MLPALVAQERLLAGRRRKLEVEVRGLEKILRECTVDVVMSATNHPSAASTASSPSSASSSSTSSPSSDVSEMCGGEGRAEGQTQRHGPKPSGGQGRGRKRILRWGACPVCWRRNAGQTPVRGIAHGPSCSMYQGKKTRVARAGSRSSRGGRYPYRLKKRQRCEDARVHLSHRSAPNTSATHSLIVC